MAKLSLEPASHVTEPKHSRGPSMWPLILAVGSLPLGRAHGGSASGPPKIPERLLATQTKSVHIFATSKPIESLFQSDSEAG